MAKLFVFGIGGTGSRVLRSLTMLLAAGVDFGADELVPIIIDPDAANGDLTRTIELFKTYSSIRQSLDFGGENVNKFFRTKISDRLESNYTLEIADIGGKQFKDFIDINTMSSANKALVKMLFSEKNLNSNMNVGFKGNPNIGSVVLNQFSHTNEFAAFAKQFNEGDKIFIISSIFGGTGASGFPLLLKTLRTNHEMDNFNVINNAEIGALTVLPYFKIQSDEHSEIDSANFISKTKSALIYYDKNIVRNNVGELNALYYLADNIINTYENHEGGDPQRNEAHLIEFLGATAIIDFSNKHYHDGGTANIELGIRDIDDTQDVTFQNLHEGLREMLYYPLAQFTLMSNALTDNLKFYRSPSFNANRKFKGFYSGLFFNTLSEFIGKYKGWLQEMKENQRSLNLFNLNCGEKPFNLVINTTPKGLRSRYWNYDLVTDRLNSAIRKCKSPLQPDKFLEMFFLGTKTLVTEKLYN